MTDRNERGIKMTPEMKKTARTISVLRPDLAGNDAIAVAVQADPGATVEEIIEGLDAATEEWNREREGE